MAKATGFTRRIVIALDQLVYLITNHWLFAVNWALTLYIALPLLAPVLMHNGYRDAGLYIYKLYGPPACHQLPERSYFLYGPQYDYSLDELNQLLGAETPQRYIGNDQIGYKIAVCQRCLAIYMTLLFAGLAFAVVRDQMPPLPWQYVLLFLAPMGIDGTGQLVGLWESTWLTRTITGISASAGLVWFLYPMIETGMRDAKLKAKQQLQKDQARSNEQA